VYTASAQAIKYKRTANGRSAVNTDQWEPSGDEETFLSHS